VGAAGSNQFVVAATLARFTVTLSAPSAVPVATTYGTANGTAMAPSDYTAKSGTLVLSPGQTSGVIYVAIKKDNLHENDETFFVNLGNPTNATIADGQGMGTILNDDP